MSAKQYINHRDLQFWLFELGNAEKLSQMDAFEEIERSDIESMLDAATTLAETEFESLPHMLDEQEPEFNGETVVTTPEHKAAIQSYIDSGFMAAGLPVKHGGLGLPSLIAKALLLPLEGIGGSAFGYLFLTNAAAYMLDIVGSDELKDKYMPNMVAGKWFGTMCLSEPQAGSSLGDIRTKAVLQADGNYHLSGSKMWISGGDQDLSENIIHMVLAKVVDEDGNTVAGSKGISLFLVPKFMVNDDGSLGQRNGFKISGINHKMGNRGTVNTVPVLGADKPCVGFLLGEQGKGLAGMFHMMNEARVGVGISAATSGWTGYRYSLDYALQRPQGRTVENPSPAAPQVNIVEHSDVRRMLLEQKALSEGGMMLTLYGAELIDFAHATIDSNEKAHYSALLALLTPVIKSWPSVYGLHANYLAIQVLGGYGYTREYPLERIYRDNRLNEIHEGTTGIQSLDFLGRKIPHSNGASLKLLIAEMNATIAKADHAPELSEYCRALSAAISAWVATTEVLLGEAKAGRQEQFLADSWTYMDMAGKIVVAWLWLKAAQVSVTALPHAAEVDQPFYKGKIRACRYFFRRELSKVAAQAQLLQSLDDTVLDADPSEL